MAHYVILEILLSFKVKEGEQENFTNYLYLSKDWAKIIALIFSVSLNLAISLN